jgi:hypothetical protein
MVALPADVASPYTCARCGRHGAAWKFEMAGPDTSWLCYRFFCDAACLANHGTNQPTPAARDTRSEPWW